MSRDLYLFLMNVSVENVFSHKYVDPKGKSISIAALDSAGYSEATDNQNSSSVQDEKAVCNVRSAESSSSASSSSDDRC